MGFNGITQVIYVNNNSPASPLPSADDTDGGTINTHMTSGLAKVNVEERGQEVVLAWLGVECRVA